MGWWTDWCGEKREANDGILAVFDAFSVINGESAHDNEPFIADTDALVGCTDAFIACTDAKSVCNDALREDNETAAAAQNLLLMGCQVTFLCRNPKGLRAGCR